MWRLLIVFALGAACGYLGHRLVSPGDPPAGTSASTLAPAGTAPAAAPDLAAKLAQAEALLRQREAEIGELRQPQGAGTPLGSRAAVLADWVRRVDRKGRPPPFMFIFRGPTGAIDPDLCDLLDVNPADRERLQAVSDETRARLAQLELTLGTLSRSPTGERVLTVPPFPDEGGVIYDSFHQRVEAILGAERFATFQTLVNTESEFEKFGTASRELSIASPPEGSRGSFSLRETLRSPTGTQGGSRGFRTEQELRAYLGPVADTLLRP